MRLQEESPSAKIKTPAPDLETSMPKKLNGPYVTATLFCGKVERSPDTGVSVISLFSRLYLDPAEAEPIPRIAIILPLYISLATGNAPGEHHLLLQVHAPGRAPVTAHEVRITLPPEPHGEASVEIAVPFETTRPGVYWFEVLCDGVMLTRVPLEVVGPDDPRHRDTRRPGSGWAAA